MIDCSIQCSMNHKQFEHCELLCFHDDLEWYVAVDTSS